MKTNKQMYIKKVKAIADWMGEFGMFYLSAKEQFNSHNNIGIYQVEVKEYFYEFCKILRMLNEATYKLSRMNANLYNDEYMVITATINIIAKSPELPSPELKCIKYLCEEYISSFIDFDLDPNCIISSETGEVVYDFRKDTPETVLARFNGKNS